MTNEQFNEFLREAAREYNRPPETPSDEMWARIEAARRASQQSRDVAPRVPTWLGWGVGIAAALALGVGIGRWIGPADVGPSTPGTVVEDGNGVSDGALRFVALEHMVRTEGFLTMVRADARAGLMDGEVAAAARDMLTTTRLLQGSAVAVDPRLKELLDDLELILVQIAQLREDSDDEERDFITQGIAERDLLLKLRAAASDQAVLTGFEGAL